MRLKDRSGRVTMGRERADAIALQGLAYLAGDGARLARFMATTGIDAATLMGGADDPALLRGVLEYLLADESNLMVFCADLGLTPEHVTAAHALIAGGHGREWND